MPDFAEWVTKGRGFGDRFYSTTRTLIAADVPSAPVLAYRNDFRTPRDFIARTTSSLWPVTNGSKHLYRPQQVTFGPTGLKIEAAKVGTQWYSGLIDTRGTTKYGQAGTGLQFLGAFRFKARVRMSAAVGMWPSIWFKPQPTSATDVNQANEYGGFPTKGEIDMFESIGNGRLYWTIHGDNPFGSGIANHWMQPSPNYTTGVDVTQWHEIWLDWRPGIGFIWYLDGTETARSDDGPNTPRPFNRPFYPIINMAVGSNNSFPPDPDGTTPLTGNLLEVDWFEAWSLGGDNDTVGTASVPGVSVRALGAELKLIKRNTGDPLITGAAPPPGGGGGTTPPPTGSTFTAPTYWNTDPAKGTTSPWYTPIDKTTAVYGAQLLPATTMASGTFMMNNSGVKVYASAATDPPFTITVSANNGTFGPSGTFVDRLPTNVQASASTDRGIQIIGYDGFNYDYYQITVNIGARTATAAARYKVPRSGTGFGTGTTKVGSRAAGCHWLGGHITAEDVAAVKAGKPITHALAVAVGNDTLKYPAVGPANRTDADGATSYFGPYNMGRLLAIPPSTPMPAGLSQFSQAIWICCRDWGSYLVDRTGNWVWVVDTGENAPAYADVDDVNGSQGMAIINAVRPTTNAKNIPGHA